MKDHEVIKAFVQKTLGCGCPEEVFNYIDSRDNIDMNGVFLRSRINIGNRLLIYVAEVDNINQLDKLLPVLLDSGKKERDLLHFNRFRLVLSAEDVSGIQKAAQKIFEASDRDGKIHLHIIRKEAALQ
jgi:hypothetical protein